MINKTDLNLVDKLILLALDDNKGNFVSDSMSFGYCLAGAVLFELSVRECISLRDGKITISSYKKTNHEVLDFCMEEMQKAKKDKKTSKWIEAIGGMEGTIKKISLKKLIRLDILEEVENKFLWIFSNNKYPTKNDVPENLIRKRLHDILVHSVKPEMDEIMIISLVDSCGLNKEVYGEELAKERSKQIKSIIKESPMADSTGKIIKELHDTIVASLVLLIATTTVITTS